MKKRLILPGEKPKGKFIGGIVQAGLGAITGGIQAAVGAKKKRNIEEPNEALLRRQAIGAQQALNDAETEAQFGLSAANRASIERQRNQAAGANRAAIAGSGGPASGRLAALAQSGAGEQQAIGDMEMKDELVKDQKRAQLMGLRAARDEKLTEQYNIEAQQAAMQRQEANQMIGAGLGNLQGAVAAGGEAANTKFNQDLSKAQLAISAAGGDVANRDLSQLPGRVGKMFAKSPSPNPPAASSPYGVQAPAGTPAPAAGPGLIQQAYGLGNIPSPLLPGVAKQATMSLFGFEDGGQVPAHEGGKTSGDVDDPITVTTSGDPNKADHHLHGNEYVIDAQSSERIDKMLDLAEDDSATPEERENAMRMAGDLAAKTIAYYRARDNEEPVIHQGPHSEAAEEVEEITGEPLSKKEGGIVEEIASATASMSPGGIEEVSEQIKVMPSLEKGGKVKYPAAIDELMETAPILDLIDQGAMLRYVPEQDVTFIEAEGYRPVAFKPTDNLGKVMVLDPRGGFAMVSTDRIAAMMQPDMPEVVGVAVQEPVAQPVAAPAPQVQPIVIQLPPYPSAPVAQPAAPKEKPAPARDRASQEPPQERSAEAMPPMRGKPAGGMTLNDILSNI